jgi:hypothetical protein
MPGYRQSHALYVSREIKWIVCQCIVFMEKCISVPHDRENNFCFPSHEKTKKIFTSTMKIPAPPNKKMVVAEACWSGTKQTSSSSHRMYLVLARI